MHAGSTRKGMWKMIRSLSPAALVLLVLPTVASGAQEAKAAGPVFVDGEAQVVPAFSDAKQWVIHDLWVETEFDTDGDGKLDRVHVDVTRPLQTETEGLRVPVIYNSSPYFSGTGSTAPEFMWNPRQQLGEFPPYRESAPPIPHQDRRQRMSTDLVDDWVPRGFAVVHSASPGTGLSQGCPSTGGANESLAPKAVVDWLNRRANGFTTPEGDESVVADWCTGKVGMTGTSYNGTIPVAAATTGVEGLEAIIPIAPNTSYYRYYRSNGLVRHPGGYMGEDIDVLYDFIHSGDPSKRDYCNSTVRDEELLEGFDRMNGDYNDFWAGREYGLQLEKYHAATLMAHAFNDWNVMPEHSVRFYAELQRKGVPCMAYFHQGGHGGPPPMRLMNRWFTRYLYGVENGIEKEPRSWIVREHVRGNEPTPYPDYPHPDAAPVRLHPEPGGNGEGGLAPSASSGTETLVDDCSVSGSDLAQSGESEHRLLYLTGELTEPLHLSGTARVTVRLSADAPAVNLSVWIVSLPWTPSGRIYDNVITRGWADPQNHESLTQGEPLEPGIFYDVAFDLQPDDHVVPAGQSIGLMIFSSDQDFTLWPEPGTHMTVDLAGTWLELPVVGGAEAFRRATGAGE